MYCVINLVNSKVGGSEKFASSVLAALANPAFLNILGSEMFFNVKEAGEQGVNEGTSYRVKSRDVGDIEFV